MATLSTRSRNPDKKGNRKPSNSMKDKENRYSLLSDESDCEYDIRTLIDSALQALPDSKGDTKLAKSTISDIVTAIVTTLVPILTASIENATQKTTSATIEKMKANIQVNNFAQNSIEQYSRKDNIKVVGLPEADKEDTPDVVVQLFNEAIIKKHEAMLKESEEKREAEHESTEGNPTPPPPPKLISREDLSTAHRIPTKKAGPRPIIAKFVRRETRDNVMKCRGGLKGHPKGKIFLHDDLTRLNDKMLWALRTDDSIEVAYSTNCVIWAITQDKKKVKVETPDDLITAGLSEEKVASLNLYNEY